MGREQRARQAAIAKADAFEQAILGPGVPVYPRPSPARSGADRLSVKRYLRAREAWYAHLQTVAAHEGLRGRSRVEHIMK